MFRMWALAILLPLCAAGAPSAVPVPATASLPSWLLGTWTAVAVRENKYVRYDPDDSPERWYSDHIMAVTPDRLTFVRDACEVSSVQAKQGPISAPIKGIAGGGGLDAFGLPPERKPVSYLTVKCARSLLDMGDGRGIVQDRGIKLTWYVIVRSPTEIDMPFLGGSYIKFRRISPTS